uniref:Guanine nucleotide-binding protein subunit gamma n=1 Tax=Ditylenchus dipsaci TaxID=166011 RepID=A0A915EGH8_9BILA
MDKSDMQRSVDSLRHQLNIQRIPISQSGGEMKRFIEGQQENDPLVNPVDKRVNPGLRNPNVKSYKILSLNKYTLYFSAVIFFIQKRQQRPSDSQESSLST